MNLHRAQMLIMALAALGLLLIAMCGAFKSGVLFMGGTGCFLLMMLVWFAFKRCPHCGKHLGQSTGIYCPHCGKKL